LNIKDLHPKLQKLYKDTSECGVVKGQDIHGKHIYFVIPPAPPKKIQFNFSIQIVSEAMSVLRKFPTYAEMDDLDKLINYLFVRKEAVESSRMEGTWSTIDEVLTPISGSESFSEATLSVRGYAHSIENLFEAAYKQREKVFQLKAILNIHKEMMQKDSRYQGIPGKIRTEGKPGAVVYIGGGGRPENSIYNPTPAKYIKESLNQVIDWLSDHELAEAGDAGVGMTLPIRMAIAHSHFEAVHPFSDGNGRVGRALWPLQMIAADVMPLYLSGYVEKEKHAYAEALQWSQKKLDYSKIIEFISHAIINSAGEMQTTKKDLLSLPKQWEERGKFRKNSAAFNALQVLLKMPIFSVEDLRSTLDCSHQAAALAVLQLAEANVVKERTGNKRNRLFAAEEVIIRLT
jgi:Fic family protein